MHTVLLESLYTVILLSIVPMAAISLGAGTTALFQTIIQVQEQSLVHLVKVLIMSILIAFGGGTALSALESIFVKAITFAASRGDW